MDLDGLTKKTNRHCMRNVVSKTAGGHAIFGDVLDGGQAKELLDLCGGNFNKYLTLEEKIKNNHVGYCPSDKDEVEKLLAMGDGSYWFDLVEFRPWDMFGFVRWYYWARVHYARRHAYKKDFKRWYARRKDRFWTWRLKKKLMLRELGLLKSPGKL